MIVSFCSMIIISSHFLQLMFSQYFSLFQTYFSTFLLSILHSFPVYLLILCLGLCYFFSMELCFNNKLHGNKDVLIRYHSTQLLVLLNKHQYLGTKHFTMEVFAFGFTIYNYPSHLISYWLLILAQRSSENLLLFVLCCKRCIYNI